MDTPIELARELKEAGFSWQPSTYDFFVIPDTGLDDHLFVLSDIMVDTDVFYGHPAFTFVGAVEWALDYVMQAEAVWVPTEAQLRARLLDYIAGKPDGYLSLESANGNTLCRLGFDGKEYSFTGESGADAYGQALLNLVKSLPA